MPHPFRLATRSSRLALWQARWAADALRRAHPGLEVALVPVHSSGDLDTATPLYAMATVGIFAKEVQAAVLHGDADAGVHSCKDLPTDAPGGLVVAAIGRRADPRDCLIGAPSLGDLSRGAVVGTSSLRRQTQLAHLRPDLRFAPIRGNVETRLAKVAAGEVAATVMAVAGLARLGLLRRAGAVPFDPWRACVPAPAQGAVAIDCRIDDHRARTLLAALHHQPTATAIGIERAVLAGLRGGCTLPLGCYARRVQGRWRLRARLARTGPTGVAMHDLDLGGPAADLARSALAELLSPA